MGRQCQGVKIRNIFGRKLNDQLTGRPAVKVNGQDLPNQL
jgi:hypothetical protein